MSFKATIEADIKGFTNNIDKAIGSVDKLEKTTLQKLSKVGDSFLKAGKVASIFSGAILAGTTAVAAFARKTGDMANDLLSATVALDSSADMLQEYKLISIEAGTDTEAFSSAVQALTRRLKEVGGEGDATTDYIDKLGVAMLDTSGQMRRTGDITNDIVRSLASMENVSERNVIASQLFGRQWVSIAPILGLGADGIEQVRAKAHELGVVLSGDALDAANKFSIEMNVIDARLSAVRDNLASRIAPLLSETIVPIIENKVIPALTNFGEKLGGVVDSFNALPQPTKEFILGITGVAVAAGPALLALGGILKTLPLIKAALAALTGPVGLVVGAIVAGTALIIANWDKLKVASKNVVDAIVSDWDYMADHLKTVSESIGKVIRGDFAGWWADVRKTFDTNIDYLKTKWQQLKGIFKEPISAEAGMAIGGIGQALKNISDEEPEATASLSNFSDAVKEIKELDTFQKLIGEQLNVRDAITKTTATIEDLQSKLVKLQLGILPSTNVRQELAETQQQINDLSTSLDLLTGGRELNIKVNTDISGLDAAENKFLKDGAIVVPPIDTSLLENSLGQAKEMVAITSQDLGSLLSSGISSFAQTIGDAFAGNWDGLGAGLLKAVGSLAQQFGSLIVGMGVAALKLQSLIVNPLTAIAAGAALIALGAAASGAAQKMMQSATGGAGYSSAPSLRDTSPGYAPSEYRGPWQDNFNVEFVIKGDNLVGVLDTAQQRRRRL